MTPLKNRLYNTKKNHNYYLNMYYFLYATYNLFFFFLLGEIWPGYAVTVFMRFTLTEVHMIQTYAGVEKQ